MVSNVPTTRVLVPSNGETLTGSEYLDASASDAVKVTKVEFRATGGALNDAVVGTATPDLLRVARAMEHDCRHQPHLLTAKRRLQRRRRSRPERAHHGHGLQLTDAARQAPAGSGRGRRGRALEPGDRTAVRLRFGGKSEVGNDRVVKEDTSHDVPLSSKSSRVPFNDLARFTSTAKQRLVDVATRVIGSGHFLLGPETRGFESDWAARCDAAHCVAVANGTDALEIALRSVGCARGDEVIVAANAGMYACSACLAIGAVPVFADVDPATLLLSVTSVTSVVAPRTRAVVATHLYGNVVDIEALRGVFRKESRSSRTAPRHTARAFGARQSGPWVTLPRSASIRRRTWERSATRARS